MEIKESHTGVLLDTVSELTCSKCGHKINATKYLPFQTAECPECSNPEQVPARLGNFLILRLIGTGGMGGVYYAKDDALGRFVAIKVMLPSLGEKKDFIENFKREAQAAAKLNHAHIAQIYSFGQEKGQPYIVMELITGTSLDKLIEQEEQVNQSLVMQVGLQISQGLQMADEAGLVHGDIKPENILLDEKLNAKLVDFGIAAVAAQGQEEGIWGTPYYIAPEKLRRQKVDARSDIYCLGGTLYHALTGRPPFDGKTPVDVVKARLVENPISIKSLRRDIDPKVESVITRMLQREPGARHPTYASLIGDFKKALETLPPPPKAIGKTGKFTTTRMGGTKKGLTAPSSVLADYRKKLAGIESSEAAQEEKREPRSWKGLVWTLVVLALLGGGAALTMHIKKKRAAELAAREEAYALQTAKESAAAACAQVLATASNITKVAANAAPFGEKASNAVLACLEVPLEAPQPVKRRAPDVIQPAADTNVPPAVSTNAPPAAPAAAEPKKARTPKAKEKEKEEEKKPQDEAAPFGEPSREMLDKQRKAKAEKSEKEPEAPAAVTNEPPPAAPAPIPAPEPTPAPERPAEEPKIKRLALDVMGGLARIGDAVADAAAAAEEARTLNDQAAAATTSAAAAPAAKQLSEKAETIKTLESDARDALAKVEKVSKDMEEEKARLLKDKLEEQKRRAEEEKRRQEEEAKRKQEEEYKAKVQGEIALAEAARQRAIPFLGQHQYKEALADIRKDAASYQTKEGIAAFSNVVDRYTYLLNLKTFITDRLKAGPLQWGWVQDTPQDVLGAGDDGVRLRDGRTVPWTSVGTKQWLKFVSALLDARDTSVKARTLAEHHLAAAIYCFENAGGNKAALDKAAEFVGKANQLSPTIQEDAVRLVPLEQ